MPAALDNAEILSYDGQMEHSEQNKRISREATILIPYFMCVLAGVCQLVTRGRLSSWPFLEGPRKNPTTIIQSFPITPVSNLVVPAAAATLVAAGPLELAAQHVASLIHELAHEAVAPLVVVVVTAVAGGPIRAAGGARGAVGLVVVIPTGGSVRATGGAVRVATACAARGSIGVVVVFA